MPSGVNVRASRCVRIRDIRSVSLRDARREDRVIEISNISHINTVVFDIVLQSSEICFQNHTLSESISVLTLSRCSLCKSR